jgi:GntR family transcriptional regulator/MocR family aminotransferase
MRLPATRDFAAQHGVSRRVVVNVFEQLQTEGYLVSRVGSGTRARTEATSQFEAPILLPWLKR